MVGVFTSSLCFECAPVKCPGSLTTLAVAHMFHDRAAESDNDHLVLTHHHTKAQITSKMTVYEFQILPALKGALK